jgi:hypothetical protein
MRRKRVHRRREVLRALAGADVTSLELGELVPCPHWQDADSPGERCGLPSEVLRSVYQGSTSGELEVIAIRCVLGHTYCGPREFLSF